MIIKLILNKWGSSLDKFIVLGNFTDNREQDDL